LNENRKYPVKGDSFGRLSLLPIAKSLENDVKCKIDMNVTM